MQLEIIGDNMFQYKVKNLLGQEINRTRHEYPYSYDPHNVCVGDYKKGDEMVYSDRLRGWDVELFDKACEQSNFNPNNYMLKSLDKASEWFTVYREKDTEVTGILEGCNHSNGFAYWIYCYRDK